MRVAAYISCLCLSIPASYCRLMSVPISMNQENLPRIAEMFNRKTVYFFIDMSSHEVYVPKLILKKLQAKSDGARTSGGSSSRRNSKNRDLEAAIHPRQIPRSLSDHEEYSAYPSGDVPNWELKNGINPPSPYFSDPNQDSNFLSDESAVPLSQYWAHFFTPSQTVADVYPHHAAYAFPDQRLNDVDASYLNPDYQVQHDDQASFNTYNRVNQDFAAHNHNPVQFYGASMPLPETRNYANFGYHSYAPSHVHTSSQQETLMNSVYGHHPGSSYRVERATDSGNVEKRKASPAEASGTQVSFNIINGMKAEQMKSFDGMSGFVGLGCQSKHNKQLIRPVILQNLTPPFYLHVEFSEVSKIEVTRGTFDSHTFFNYHDLDVFHLRANSVRVMGMNMNISERGVVIRISYVTRGLELPSNLKDDISWRLNQTYSSKDNDATNCHIDFHIQYGNEERIIRLERMDYFVVNKDGHHVPNFKKQHSKARYIVLGFDVIQRYDPVFKYGETRNDTAVGLKFENNV